MIGSFNNIPERLYLHKDAVGEVSVPCDKLAQHQIDCIRFLYKQHKKAKPGVILNYPSGCGSLVQVGTFINAIYTDLEKPVLIVYETQQEKEDWLEVFSNWTDIDIDKIAVDSPNAFVRKPIYLKDITKVNTFCRREWSVLVVKRDEVSREFLKCPLNADFKIWISSTDMKKNREMLCSLYMWIYPSQDKGVQNYFKLKSEPMEVFMNNLLLDSLLEDVLLAKRNVKQFRIRKRNHEPEIETTPAVSRKNKDATGTKIKRSKKVQETVTSQRIESATVLSHKNDETIINSSNNKANNSNSTITEEDFIASYNTNKFDHNNKSKRRSKRNIICDEVSDQNNMVQNINVSNNSEIVSVDNVHEEFNKTNEVTENNFKTSIIDVDDEKSKMDVESFIRDNMPLQKDDSNLCTSIRNFDNASPKTEETSTDSLNFSHAVDEILRIENHTTIEKSQNSQSLCIELNNEAPKNLDFKQTIQNVFSVDEDSNGKPELVGVVSVEHNDVQKCLGDGRNKGKGDQVEEKVTPSVMKETDRSFEAKMKEMEMKALQKFKGSFLDSIF